MKISLIFACYNVSKYLDDLYELLISQPYKNVEFIFVDIFLCYCLICSDLFFCFYGII